MNKKFNKEQLVWMLGDEFDSYEIENQKLEKFGYYMAVSNNTTFINDFSKYGTIAKGLLVQPSFNLKEKHIINLHLCKIIASIGVGYNNIDVNAATKKGIIVTHVPDYCVEEVSDHTIFLILALNRRILDSQKMINQGEWKAVDIGPIRRLKGQILGLVGFGRIAQTVARKAICLGLEVVAYDPYKSNIEMSNIGVKKVELIELVRSSDIISLHVFLTDETLHLFNRDMFLQMKKTAYLINACRGEVVDEDALIQALQDKQIAGAGLDVLTKEPPNPENPLLHMSNTIVTPHSAYISQEALFEVRERAVQAVIDALNGKVPQNIINSEVLQGK